MVRPKQLCSLTARQTFTNNSRNVLRLILRSHGGIFTALPGSSKTETIKSSSFIGPHSLHEDASYTVTALRRDYDSITLITVVWWLRSRPCVNQPDCKNWIKVTYMNAQISYFYAAYTVQMSADLFGRYEAKSSQRKLFHRQLHLGI